MRTTARYLLLLTGLLLGGALLPSPAAIAADPPTLTAASGPEHDELRRQNIEEFQRWRATIPDYERRLYDRVKMVRDGVLRLGGAVVVGFLVLGALIVYFGTRLLRLQAIGVGGGDRRGIITARRFHRLRDQQLRLQTALAQLSVSIASLDDGWDGGGSKGAGLARAVAECERLCRQVEAEFAGPVQPTVRRDG